MIINCLQLQDALSDRIGIMVGGELKCLGTSQQLKDKYGSGFRLSLTSSDNKAEQVREWVQTLPFANVETVKQFGGTQHFDVTSKEASQNILADLFEQVEQNKQQFGIVDYSISQSTLEQVFLNFANAQ